MSDNLQKMNVTVAIDSWRYKFIKETEPLGQGLPEETKQRHEKLFQILEAGLLKLRGTITLNGFPVDYLASLGVVDFQGKVNFFQNLLMQKFLIHSMIGIKKAHMHIRNYFDFKRYTYELAPTKTYLKA